MVAAEKRRLQMNRPLVPCTLCISTTLLDNSSSCAGLQFARGPDNRQYMVSGVATFISAISTRRPYLLTDNLYLLSTRVGLRPLALSAQAVGHFAA